MTGLRDDAAIRAWLRGRADTGAPTAPVLASVMAEVDRVPQRRPRPWTRRWGSDLPRGLAPANLRLASAVTTLLLVAILVLLLVALLAGSRRPPSPLGSAWSTVTQVTWSPDGSHLTFLLDDVAVPAVRASPGTSVAPGTGPVQRLYVVAADGSGLRELAAGAPASNWAPQWSPDGAYVFLHEEIDRPPPFTGDGPFHLFAVAVDGSSPKVDLGVTWQEAWAPSGHRFAATDDSSDLVVGTAVSPEVRRVATAASMPTWSPDEAWILYQQVDPSGSGQPQSWLVRADGTDAHALAFCPAGEVVWSRASGNLLCRTSDDTRAFHVDGTPAAGDPSEGLPYGALSADGRAVLAWQEADQAGIRIVTAGGSLPLTDGDGDAYPTWSPDGRWVAFWGHRASGSGLFVVPASGASPPVLVGANAQWPPVAVTPEPGSVQWAPAGPPRLAFVRDHSIVLAPADGSPPAIALGDDRLAAPRGDASPSASADVEITILDDGPDRAIYHAPAGKDPVFVFRNQSDVTWTVDFFDDGGGTHVCPQGSRTGPLVASVRVVPTGSLPLDEVPVTCDIPPHTAQSITERAFVPGGAFKLILSTPSVSRPIWVDFDAPP